MVWHITKDVEEFLDAAGGFLRARPCENTVLLTAAETLRVHGPAAFGSAEPMLGWHDGGDAVFLRTPPHQALISGMSAEVAAELAGVLSAAGVPSADGPDAAATAFAEEWQRRTGAGWRVRRRHRLHRLGSLMPPSPLAEGSARRAVGPDRELLVDWMTTFFQEVGEEAHHVERFVDDKLAHGSLLLWEVDGRPVSMASTTRPLADMVRIQAVYTPKADRGRGYAAAATAALSRDSLDAGSAQVVLLTGLSNHTSNALYQRLGYVPMEDRSMVEFIA